MFWYKLYFASCISVFLGLCFFHLVHKFKYLEKDQLPELIFTVFMPAWNTILLLFMMFYAPTEYISIPERIVTFFVLTLSPFILIFLWG